MPIPVQDNASDASEDGHYANQKLRGNVILNDGINRTSR